MENPTNIYCDDFKPKAEIENKYDKEIFNLINKKTNEAYVQGYTDRVAVKLMAHCDSLNDALKRGWNEAWKLAGRIVVSCDTKADAFNDKELQTIFGTRDIDEIFVNNTAQEAIEKVKAWEEKTRDDVGNIVEFREKLKNGELAVGDELVTTDIDGEAIFVVVHLKDDKAYMVRKWLLDNSAERPLINNEFNAFDWLNGEYRKSLPEDISDMIVGDVTLPSEKEVFGENKLGTKEDDDEQFDWFKIVTHRVTAYSPEDESTIWWWTRTKVDKVSASYFAYVNGYGNANYISPSYPWDGLRPYFVLSEI